LGILAYEVIRLWLNLSTPGASVLEPQGTPIKYLAFPSRSGARRFMKLWGGKLILT
jgi:hypothetical protein